MKIFTVYDSKAEAYLQPFFAKTHGLAIRQFQQAVNTADHQFHNYAEDYTLFVIGMWDENNCLIEMLTCPETLGNAMTFIEKE